VLWLIVFLLGGAIAAYLTTGLIGLGAYGSSVLLLTGLTIRTGFRIIPGNPPHKAIVTFLGRKKRDVRPEGPTIILPLVEDLILIDMTLRTQRVVITGARASDNAPMNITIGLFWNPDGDRLPEHVNAGGEEGVRRALDQITSDIGRQFVSRRKWEAVKRSHTRLQKELLMAITGQEFADGKDQTPQDLHSLGIKVSLLNVIDVELDPSSAIAKEADRQAREEVQRHGGVYEAETYAMVAQTLVDRAKERGIELQVSEDLIRFLMKNEAIREGHGQYHEFGIAGLDKLIQAFVSRS